MLAQAAGFAFLAAISPTALLVMAVFLGSANPRKTALAYVAGAIAMSVLMAVLVLLVIRGTSLNLQRNHDPRYGLRLGLGVLAVAGAVVLIRRRPRVLPSGRADPSLTGPDRAGSSPAGASAARSGGGLVSRLVARPSARSAFAAGILLFAPSATFIAAVQVIATSTASVAAIALGLLVIVIVSVLIVWLPLLAFLSAPEATTRRLGQFNGWLRAHSKLLAVTALGAGGAILIVNGLLGLTSVL
jgi:hypothetical protein